ncbi:MAG: phosphopantetheine-binding protein [Pseudomonadota bacterium]
MTEEEKLKEEIKKFIVETLNLKINPVNIADITPLFGDNNGLGLDSLDMLELYVSVEERYGIVVEEDIDPNTFKTINDVAKYIQENVSEEKLKELRSR